MGKARDWGDIGAEGGPGAIHREGDDPATDIPVDDAPPQPNGNGGAYLTEEELRGPREPDYPPGTVLRLVPEKQMKKSKRTASIARALTWSPPMS
jgi:hypothetical protein